MTAFLPPNLLALFAPRDPIPFLPPNDKLSHEKKRLSYLGVSQYLKDFEDPKDTPAPTRVETKEERQERKKKEKQEQVAYKLEQDLALWDPHSITHSTGDPFKTLFIARINYDTSESKLRREFEVYGPIRKIQIVEDQIKSKPRGYAFIEFEHERDMHSAYKHADGKKIDGRRVLVDVERGRTVKGWQPRRLGGGLGGTRRGGADENTRFSGRDDFPGGGERRDRSRSREPRRRPSPARERRRDRSRSRDRERPRRSRSPGRRARRNSPDADVTEIDEVPTPREKRRRRRSRSRDRGDRPRRSRSTDRKRPKRSRSREPKRDKTEGELYPGEEQFVPPPPPPPDDGTEEDIKVKMEPIMDEGYGQEVKSDIIGGGDRGMDQQPTQNEYEEQYGDY